MKASSDSCGLPAVPDLRNVEAWKGEATRSQAAAAVSAVLAIAQPDADDDQAVKLVDLVTRRGYTQAELAYAVRELPFDPALDKKLQFSGTAITAADFERLIGDFRRLRKQLSLKLRLEDVNRLIEKHPNWLSWEDFGICGYTAADTPLYRYCYEGVVDDRTPHPVLEEDERPGADREGEGGTYAIAELIANDPPADE